MATLENIPIGQPVRIASYKDLFIASRLMSMGIIPGTEVQIVRTTFSGSTYFLQFPHLSLALRKDEVEQIVIE